MNSVHQYLAENICKDIKENRSIQPITLIHGQFGIGKSEIVREVFSKFGENSFFDCLININFDVEKRFISNYLKSTEIRFPKSDAGSFNSDINETFYNDNRLSELLRLLSDKDKDIADTTTKQFQLKLFPPIEDSENLGSDEFVKKIEALLDKKGDRRLILENSRVTAESLIVDLMNIFFPNSEKFTSFDKYLETITSPVKILFVFDNFDRIAYSIFNWLSEYFLPTCLQSKFGDFIAFNVRDSEKELFINQFFDFHFIISNRVDPSLNDFFPFFSKNLDFIQKFELGLWNRDESLLYLQSQKLPENTRHDDIIAASFGNQFLMDMFMQEQQSEIKEFDKKTVYNKIIEKYLDGKTAVQVDTIKLASLLGTFSINDLKSFPALFDKYTYSWKFLLFLNDLTEIADQKLSFRHPFDDIFKLAFADSSKQEILESKNLPAILESISEIIPNLTDDELKIVRSLAYFENFDFEIAVESAFLDKASDAKIFVQKNSSLFFKHLHTHSLKGDIRNVLMKLNNVIDNDKLEAKRNLVQSIWDKRLNEITIEKNIILEKLSILNKESDEFNGDPTKGKSYYEEHQRKFIKAENDLIQLRKSLGDFSSNRFLINLIINTSATILSFLTSYYFPDIFSTPDNHTSIIVIQYILYFISLVFGFLSIHNGYKIFRIRMQRAEIKAVEDNIALLEQEKLGYQEEMKLFKDSKSSWQKRSQEVSEQIKTLKFRLDAIESIIKESYI
jgi:hypothetical protein